MEPLPGHESGQAISGGLACRDVDGNQLEVSFGGNPLVSYVYVPSGAQLESPRPYFHPARTLAGHVVTVYQPDGHPWHKGISWALPHVGPENFWGGPTYSREQGYVQRENNGSMNHRRLVVRRPAGEVVDVRHELAWHTQSGAHLVDEARVITVGLVLHRTAWALVFDTTMTNATTKALQLGSPTTAGRENAGYGGLFWRGPHSFTGGQVLAPGREGGDELRGERAAWMGFCGRHETSSRWSTLVFVDDQRNPRHPPQWFVRSEVYAAICAAPFFSSEMPFLPGADLRFRFAVVVADGKTDADDAAVLAQAGQRLLDAVCD